jgi:hypothetical protein
MVNKRMMRTKEKQQKNRIKQTKEFERTVVAAAALRSTTRTRAPGRTEP